MHATIPRKTLRVCSRTAAGARHHSPCLCWGCLLGGAEMLFTATLHAVCMRASFAAG